MAFVHLHNHTEYSLLDGATHIIDMVRRAAEFDMPAIAITDHGVMSGVPELSDACDSVEKETGKRVKPIFGCEIYFTEDPEIGNRKRSQLYHMILLAKNNTGYHNLLKLVSESHVDNFYYKPRTTFDMLERYSEGVIATSACIAGIIPRNINDGLMEEAENWARRLAALYAPGDFYIELQNQGLGPDSDVGLRMTQTEMNYKLTEIANKLGLKTIATNDFHYLTQEDARAQDIMLCIGTGSKIDETQRMRFANDQFYMKSEAEMREAMREFPEACDNTVELAEKCNVELERDSILPRFPLPEGETEESYFRRRCEEGLVKRYGPDWRNVEINGINVGERYEYEAGIIIQQGFPAYFLIVQEYIEWARSQGIGVGPGRGSAAGAIVAYAMGITDIDPLSNGLLFERFLNPERVEMPDIDVDFDDERRGEVIQHIKDFYGEDHIAGVITFGTLKAKNAVRDAARVLDKPYAAGDRVAKLIGDELGITIDQVMGWDSKHPDKANPDLIAAYEAEDEVKQIIDAARSIEGNVRGEGVHACATIICRDPMADHVPVKRDTKNEMIITQYDGHFTPELGLLKMDFLGLRTLGVLTRACRNVKERFGIDMVPEEIPIDDEKAFKLLRSGGNSMDGLFQVESPLYVSLFKRLPPHTFADVVASIALNRPGPLQSGMVDDYVEVASGRTEAHYYDNRLRPILEETYGTMVYQEQIMQVSMAMSGFSAGKADKLRKAMGKKKISVMRELQEDWNQGAVDNGYSLEVAKKIWDDAEKFAEYAFNKSHSAAYALLVMRTAYLKAHYPNDYMAAVLSSYVGRNDKLIRYISSCNRSGIAVQPPDVNRSNLEFTPIDEGILFGLAGIRGVGAKVAQMIIDEREQGGRFTSLHDFVNRMDSKAFNRKTLEALIKSGAFDSTGYTRRQLMYFIDETPLLEDAARRQKDKDAGQISMFDMFGDDADSGFQEDVPEPDGVEWDKRTLLAFEKDILKMYISDHPLTPYENYLAKKTETDCGTLAAANKSKRNIKLGGMVSELNTRRTKRGTLMATFALEDTTGAVEAICFDYEKYRDVIEDDAIILVEGKFEVNDRGNQIVVFKAERLDLEEAKAASGPRQIGITVEASMLNSYVTQKLLDMLKQHPGKSSVVLYVTQKNGKRMRAELPVTIDANNQLLRAQVSDLLGYGAWKAS